LKIIGQAETYVGNAETMPMCCTTGISLCSVLIIKNERTNCYLITHIGTQGFDFIDSTFITPISEFLKQDQVDINDCKACFIYNGEHSVRHKKIIHILTELNCKIEELIAICPDKVHLGVMYDAKRDKIMTQFGVRPEIKVTSFAHENIVRSPVL
jgi:hypothetical protein